MLNGVRGWAYQYTHPVATLSTSKNLPKETARLQPRKNAFLLNHNISEPKLTKKYLPPQKVQTDLLRKKKCPCTYRHFGINENDKSDELSTIETNMVGRKAPAELEQPASAKQRYTTRKRRPPNKNVNMLISKVMKHNDRSTAKPREAVKTLIKETGKNVNTATNAQDPMNANTRQCAPATNNRRTRNTEHKNKIVK